MNVIYPNLIAEIARRGIKKNAIAKHLGICAKSLNNKLCGKSSFTWYEVCEISHQFFPDVPQEFLFMCNNTLNSANAEIALKNGNEEAV